MARVLAYTSPARGHLFPLTPILDEVHRRGHQIAPFGPGLPPAHGPVGHLRDRLLRPIVMGAIEKAMLPSLNSVRVQIGLPPLEQTDELFRRPPLLLYMTAEPFEYPRSDWPDNVVLVGPCVWEPPAETPEWLERIDQPIVLVTTSSEFQNDGRLVATALQALADEPVHAVATLPAGDPVDYSVPLNAHVERFVPHAPLLERAVCAVTRGNALTASLWIRVDAGYRQLSVDVSTQ